MYGRLVVEERDPSFAKVQDAFVWNAATSRKSHNDTHSMSLKEKEVS